MTDRKLPRLDLRKFLGGGVAGRREAVTLVGDALREEGAVRVEGHESADQAGLAAVGGHLLAALADYFGLAEDAFGAGVASPVEPPFSEASTEALLVVLGGVPAGTELRVASETWRPVSAHTGELLAAPGVALAALTHGVVRAAGLRWPGDATVAVALAVPSGEAVAALPQFRSPG